MWPPHLAQEIPTFARWLSDHVKTQMANGVVVDPDMVVYSCPPSTSTYTYNICGHMETTTWLMLKHGQHMPRMTMMLHAYLGKVVIIMYETRTL